jgi:hypothetical protein
VENTLLASGEARGARVGRGKESRAQRTWERSVGGHGKQQAGPTQEHKSAARNRVGICHTLVLPPAWSLLAAIGRDIEVIAGAPLLLLKCRGRRRRGRRLQQRVGRRHRTRSRQRQCRGWCRHSPSLILSGCSLGLSPSSHAL